MLFEAIQKKDLTQIKSALEKGSDINGTIRENGLTPLTCAAEMGYLEGVDFLLNAGADPNLPGELGYTPILCGITSFMHSGQSLEVSKLLVERGADIDGTNADGETALEVLLYEASGEDEVEEMATYVVETMLEKDPDRDFSKVAHLVVDYGWVSTLKLMVENGLDIEQEDRFGYSLLHEACRQGQINKVGFFLKAGANYNYRPKLGWEDHPFEVACRFGRVDLLQWLKEDGFDFQAEKGLLKTGINSAIQSGKGKVIDYLLGEGIDLRMPFEGYETPLMTAIKFDQSPFFVNLLQGGVDLEEKDRDGNKAVHFAAYYGRLEMLQKLSEAGANLHTLNNLDWTPLMQAAVEGQLPVVEYLIKKGLELDQTDRETGATALIVAAAEGNLEVVKKLLEAGADPDLVAFNGRTAATWAKGELNEEVVRLLGEIKPHFTPHPPEIEGEKVCAYCAWPLTEKMLEHNHCPDCDAYYCDDHYPWSDWRLFHVTNIHPNREVICPNGHYRMQ